MTAGIEVTQSDISKQKDGCLRQVLVTIGQPRYQKGGPARVGTASHAVMAAYVTHCREEVVESDVQWARKEAERVCALLSHDDERDLRSFIFNAIEKVDISWVTTAQVVYVEERFHIYASDGWHPVSGLGKAAVVASGGTVFSGTPDVWWIDQQGILHVLDWKSGHVIDHIEEAAENYQLRLYSGAIMAVQPDIHSAHGHIVHLRHSAQPEISGYVDPDTPPRPWGRELVEWMTGVVMTTADTLRGRTATQQDAVYGGHCTRCESTATCDAYHAKVADITVPDTPEGLLQQGKILKMRGEDMLERLAVRMDKENPVTDGHFLAQLVETTKRSEWKSSAFMKLREMLTEDELAQVCQPTKTRLAKVFKKHKMADALDGFCAEHMDATLDTELKITVAGKRASLPPVEVS